MSASLQHWIDAQFDHAGTAMLASVSACDLCWARPGLAHPMRPGLGSVVASPLPGSYDPEPDYFFHWYRDAALVIDALRLLQLRSPDPGRCATFGDFIAFSAGLAALDGRTLAAQPGWRAAVSAPLDRYLRSAEDLAAVHGDGVAGEARVNPDGTLDILRWARPQHDGPALRALTVLRWMRDVPLAAPIAAAAAALARADLGYVSRHALQEGFDIWEEEPGRHYHALRVSAAALEAGAAWLETQADDVAARPLRAQSRSLLATLDGYWHDAERLYCARGPATSGRGPKDPDISIVLAAIHAGAATGAHSAEDPRVQATLARLAGHCDATYPINRSRGPGRGAALGRYPGDRYVAGGAYYFATLAGAELWYRAGHADRGDAYLATVREFTPADGALAEQFDQRSGAPASARQLAWSYAAFISCVEARRALQHLPGAKQA